MKKHVARPGGRLAAGDAGCRMRGRQRAGTDSDRGAERQSELRRRRRHGLGQSCCQCVAPSSGFAVTGMVKTVHVTVGDRVTAGQPLIAAGYGPVGGRGSRWRMPICRRSRSTTPT